MGVIEIQVRRYDDGQWEDVKLVAMQEGLFFDPPVRASSAVWFFADIAEQLEEMRE